MENRILLLADTSYAGMGPYVANLVNSCLLYTSPSPRD